MGIMVFSIPFFWQLSSVTEERDQLKNVIDELKKHKNVEAEGDIVNGALFQVVQLHFYFTCSSTFSLIVFVLVLDLQGQGLESCLAKKEYCLKELESNLCGQKESIHVSTMK
ncbi:hypothetical protein CsSME_00007227 [Camellia sinensis var. sinensis]